MRCRPCGGVCVGAAVLLLLAGPAGCDCRGQPAQVTAPALDAGEEPDLSSRPSSLEPTPREPGPPRAESRQQLAREEQGARGWIEAMLKGGLPRREVASMADIRGYRLYRRRFFGRAASWFEQAVRTDPTYEPALFNAARAAALRGDAAAALKHLQRLEGLKTPLSQRQLVEARHGPDFEILFQVRAAPPRR